MTSSRDLQDKAAVWDRIHSRIPQGFKSVPYSAKVSEVTEVLVGQGVREVLDLGCGPGRWAMLLARFGMNVVGVDISKTAIGVARDWAKEEKVTAEFLVAPSWDLPLPDRSFDAVLASSVLDHMSLQDASRTMDEIRRVLKEGAFLFVSFDGPDPEPLSHEILPDGTWVFTEGSRAGMAWRCYSDQEINDLLQGFEIIHWQSMSGGARWIFARLA